MFNTYLTAMDKTWSTRTKKTAAKLAKTKTINVVIMVSLRVGQVTFCASCFTCLKNLTGLILAISRTLSFSIAFAVQQFKLDPV